jgi:hypothetical protein
MTTTTASSWLMPLIYLHLTTTFLNMTKLSIENPGKVSSSKQILLNENKFTVSTPKTDDKHEIEILDLD